MFHGGICDQKVWNWSAMKTMIALEIESKAICSKYELVGNVCLCHWFAQVYYLCWQQELPLNRTMIWDVWCWNVKSQAPCLLASISFLATHPSIGYFLAFPTTGTSFMFDFSLAEHNSYPVQNHTGHHTVGWTVLIMGCLASCIPVLYY
jgi:hypothetical protein